MRNNYRKGRRKRETILASSSIINKCQIRPSWVRTKKITSCMRLFRACVSDRAMRSRLLSRYTRGNYRPCELMNSRCRNNQLDNNRRLSNEIQRNISSRISETLKIPSIMISRVLDKILCVHEFFRSREILKFYLYKM